MAKYHMERMDDDLSSIESSIVSLKGDLSAMAKDVNVAFQSALADLRRTELRNLELQKEARMEAAASIQKAELDALNSIYRSQLDLEQKKTKQRMESIQRTKRAELEALVEIQDLRVQTEEKLTQLQKQRSIMSPANWKEYAAQTAQNKALQNQIEANNAWIEALVEKGYTPDSKQGQRLQRQQEQAKATEATEKYAKGLIAQLPMIGAKLGETNDNKWLGALKDMLAGGRKGDDGARHSIGVDAKVISAAKKTQADKEEKLYDAAVASGNRKAYLKQYETVRETLLARDKKTGKTKYDEYNELTQANQAKQNELSDLQKQSDEIDKQLKRSKLSKNKRAELKAQKEKISSKIAETTDEATKITAAINQALADSGLDQLDETQKEMLKADNDVESANMELQRTIYASAANTTTVLASLAESLESLSDTISSYQSTVDTRLYGSTENEQQLTSTGWSYWKQISYDLSATMLSPLIKEETLMNNVIAAVEKGISKDVTQVAMLETIKDKIATTFNAFDGTMRRLIRIQDTNTTAARLGMEAALNELLNEMYETTEYLSDLASSVRDNLVEAEALMEGDEAVEFEYQVQKWLGSLYSVGMSSSGVSAISTALGQLASGDISGITSGGASNLLIMAANNAGLSISDILAEGLDSSETNQLLSAMVEYMAELVEESGDSLVVQQQLANVYGLTASDLEAATNITGTYNGKAGYLSALSSYTGSYSSMLSNLVDMAYSMYSRTSLGELINNVWSNVQYSTASGMTNIVSQLTLKVADILDAYAGGVPIGAYTFMGTGGDTKLTVSNILKSASVVGGFTSSLVSLLGSLADGSAGGFTGEGLLKLVGIDTSGTTNSGGTGTSKSGTATIYNSNVDDMTDSATASANDEVNNTLVEAQEESTEVTNSTINENIVNIYTLLQNVIDGSSALSVKLTNEPIEVVAATTGMSTWN